jgi:hypothetical protein
MSVRDRIPELLAERGVPFEARNASKAELPGLLLAKLDEEIAEDTGLADLQSGRDDANIVARREERHPTGEAAGSVNQSICVYPVARLTAPARVP